MPRRFGVSLIAPALPRLEKKERGRINWGEETRRDHTSAKTEYLNRSEKDRRRLGGEKGE